MTRILSDRPKKKRDRFYDYYRYAPFSIWEEDFSEVRQCFDDLKKKGINDVRLYFERHPEEILSLARKIKVLWVNDATLKMYEAESQDELLKDLSIIFNKESYDVFREELIALSDGKTEFNSVAVNRTLKGRIRHILLKVFVPPGSENTLSNVLVYIVDISDIKRDEEELKTSAEKYRAIFETAYDPVFLIDVETGIILEVNRQAEHLLAIPSGQIVGMHFTQLYPHEEADRQRRLFQSHVNHGQYNSENIVICISSGRRCLVTMNSSVIEVQGKRCMSVVFRQIAEGSKTPQDKARIIKSENALTARENEIVKLIASGLTTKKIAETLFVSEKTIGTHRARIMQKLGIHKSADLVRYAFVSGLLEDL